MDRLLKYPEKIVSLTIVPRAELRNRRNAQCLVVCTSVRTLLRDRSDQRKYDGYWREQKPVRFQKN